MKRGQPLRRVPMQRRKRTDPELAAEVELALARERVLRRAGWRCEAKLAWPEVRCDRGEPVVHHKKQRSLGGDHEPDNLVVLCVTHHAAVHDNIALAHERGLLTHSWE
jgi:5-methylcytosine-specific restriction endonuclease McrA